ncbi:hypothetical protein QEZ54_23790 [Catellatospora sp. KI3]|uniref:hypothetical protein n=1 Tax=Catellatospora sp. KI3 TaxID=3041620 RepID=UPI00248274F2|nr:hypothetical protein [Catellatospora sp. KI3]MDI1464012.1 hypothetical protein [Catellatospora sp. KI3]
MYGRTGWDERERELAAALYAEIDVIRRGTELTQRLCRVRFAVERMERVLVALSGRDGPLAAACQAAIDEGNLRALGDLADDFWSDQVLYQAHPNLDAELALAERRLDCFMRLLADAAALAGAPPS